VDFDSLDVRKKTSVIFLSPAVVRTSVTVNGSTIPAGTVVVARDDVASEAFVGFLNTKRLQFNLCLVTTHLCAVSYRIAGKPVALAQLQDASLEVIRQGWQKVPGGPFEPTPRNSPNPTAEAYADEPYPSSPDYPTKLPPLSGLRRQLEQFGPSPDHFQ
jgi:hypothetical protein